MANSRRTKLWWLSHRVTVLGLSTIIALQSGCAMLPPVPNTHYQTTLGRVAVLATLQVPEISFEGFVQGKVKGAATGAGNAFLECTRAFANSSCSGEICGAVVILMLGACSVTSAVGGVIGSVKSPGVDEVQSSEDSLSTVLDARTVQESLRYQIEVAALGKGTSLVPVSQEYVQAAVRFSDYRPFADAGVDTLLIVALTEVGAIGSDIEGPLLLRMQAHVQLIRTRDNFDIFSADYFYIGQKVKLSNWSINEAERLLADLQNGYKILGAHIFDSVFLLYPFPDRQPHWSGFLAITFGLAPIYPPTRGQVTGDPMTGVPISRGDFEWTSVDTLRPTLRWQEFPRATDFSAAPEEMGRVNNVRYDLVIARENDFAPAEIVYRREGLPDTAHTFETSLKPAARYYWTVRARFELDGRERVTEWGSTHFKVREQWTAPSLLSYRFRTPK